MLLRKCCVVYVEMLLVAEMLGNMLPVKGKNGFLATVLPETSKVT